MSYEADAVRELEKIFDELAKGKYKRNPTDRIKELVRNLIRAAEQKTRSEVDVQRQIDEL